MYSLCWDLYTYSHTFYVWVYGDIYLKKTLTQASTHISIHTSVPTDIYIYIYIYNTYICIHRDLFVHTYMYTHRFVVDLRILEKSGVNVSSTDVIVREDADWNDQNEASEGVIAATVDICYIHVEVRVCA
jgi:hypothetical protein